METEKKSNYQTYQTVRLNEINSTGEKENMTEDKAKEFDEILERAHRRAASSCHAHDSFDSLKLLATPECVKQVNNLRKGYGAKTMSQVFRCSFPKITNCPKCPDRKACHSQPENEYNDP